ncbi:unnamed protein product [Parajaminaea phylloscopi]
MVVRAHGLDVIADPNPHVPSRAIDDPTGERAQSHASGSLNLNLNILAAASSHHSDSSPPRSAAVMSAASPMPLRPLEAMTPSTAFPDIMNIVSDNGMGSVGTPAWLQVPPSALMAQSTPSSSTDRIFRSPVPLARPSQNHTSVGKEKSAEKSRHGSADEEDLDEDEEEDDDDDDEDDDDDDDDDDEEYDEDGSEAEDLEAEASPIDWNTIDADTFFQNFLSAPGMDWTTAAAKSQGPRRAGQQQLSRQKRVENQVPASTSQTPSAIVAPSPSEPLPSLSAYPLSPHSVVGTPGPNYDSAIDLLTTVLGSGQDVPPEILTSILSSIAPALGYQPSDTLSHGATTPSQRPQATGDVDSLVPILRALIEKQQQQRQKSNAESMRSIEPMAQPVDPAAQFIQPPPVSCIQPGVEEDEDDEINDPSYEPSQHGDNWLTAATATSAIGAGSSPVYGANDAAEFQRSVQMFLHSPTGGQDAISPLQSADSRNQEIDSQRRLKRARVVGEGSGVSIGRQQAQSTQALSSRASRSTEKEQSSNGHDEKAASFRDVVDRRASLGTSKELTAGGASSEPTRAAGTEGGAGASRTAASQRPVGTSTRGRKPIYKDEASRKAARLEANRIYQKEWRQRRKEAKQLQAGNERAEDDGRAGDRQAGFRATPEHEREGSSHATQKSRDRSALQPRQDQSHSTRETGQKKRPSPCSRSESRAADEGCDSSELLTVENRLLKAEIERLRKENVSLRVELEMMSMRPPRSTRLPSDAHSSGHRPSSGYAASSSRRYREPVERRSVNYERTRHRPRSSAHGSVRRRSSHDRYDGGERASSQESGAFDPGSAYDSDCERSPSHFSTRMSDESGDDYEIARTGG